MDNKVFKRIRNLIKRASFVNPDGLANGQRLRVDGEGHKRRVHIYGWESERGGHFQAFRRGGLCASQSQGLQRGLEFARLPQGPSLGRTGRKGARSLSLGLPNFPQSASHSFRRNTLASMA